MRMVAVHLVDSAFATDAQKFVSVAMLSLSTMMRLELPHVNVLTKADLLREENLDFPLYFYTETPEFAVLSNRIQAPAKLRKLINAVCELLDDYSQVAFQMLSVYKDDHSMQNLLDACDRACGWLPVTE